MIIVTGGVTARPDSVEALKAACLAHSARSRLEPGCLEHTLHVDGENPLRLFFYERWTDAAALRAHLQTTDLAGFVVEARALAAAAERTLFYEAEPLARAVIAG